MSQSFRWNMWDMGGLECVGGRWVPDWLNWLDDGPPPHTWTQMFNFSSGGSNCCPVFSLPAGEEKPLLGSSCHCSKTQVLHCQLLLSTVTLLHCEKMCWATLTVSLFHCCAVSLFHSCVVSLLCCFTIQLLCWAGPNNLADSDCIHIRAWPWYQESFTL